VILIVSVPGLAGAETESGTETLERGEFLAVEVDFTEGKSCRVSFSLSVSEGPAIDVYFVTQEHFAAYERDVNFQYIIPLSPQGTRDIEMSEITRVNDVYFLVFDNTDWGTSPPADPTSARVTFDYEVTIDINEGGGIGSLLLWIVVIIVTGCIVASVVVLRAVRGRPHRAQGHRPAMGAGPPHPPSPQGMHGTHPQHPQRPTGPPAARGPAPPAPPAHRAAPGGPLGRPDMWVDLGDPQDTVPPDAGGTGGARAFEPLEVGPLERPRGTAPGTAGGPRTCARCGHGLPPGGDSCIVCGTRAP
jgi:hypothetical protein